MSENEKASDPLLNISEFDFLMSAMSIYCMTAMNKEQFWTIINHVEDGYEFDTAVEAQEILNDITENYYTMKHHFESLGKND
tara:strand:+ start:2444 stop:2689 length:246 start_codon:yes stop_codon:yes gene_type:complete